jgi:hypothetical protein
VELWPVGRSSLVKGWEWSVDPGSGLVGSGGMMADWMVRPVPPDAGRVGRQASTSSRQQAVDWSVGSWLG